MMVGAGTAPDPLVWDQGGRPKGRKIDFRVNIDLASLPGSPGFLGGPGCRFMEVVFLVPILLPGLTVLAFSVNLLLFLEPCIGRWFLRTWVILGLFFGTCYPFRAMGWTSVAQ